MGKPVQKTPAPNANDTAEGKVPVAPRPAVDFDSTMDALLNAGSARGQAVDAVCSYIGGRTFNPADATAVDALNAALKVSKLAKLAKIVGAVLNIVKIGGDVTMPPLNPVDYK